MRSGDNDEKTQPSPHARDRQESMRINSTESGGPANSLLPQETVTGGETTALNVNHIPQVSDLKHVEEGIEHTTHAVSPHTLNIASAASGDLLGPESLQGGLTPGARNIGAEQTHDPFNARYKQQIAQYLQTAKDNETCEHHHSSDYTKATPQVAPKSRTDTLNSSSSSIKRAGSTTSTKASEEGFTAAVASRLKQVKDDVKSKLSSNDISSEDAVLPITNTSVDVERNGARRFSFLRRRASALSNKSKSTASIKSVSNEEKAGVLAEKLVNQHSAYGGTNTGNAAVGVPSFSVTPMSDDEKTHLNREKDTSASNPDNLDTVAEEGHDSTDYFDSARKSKAGILGNLLKLYSDGSKSKTPKHTPAATPQGLSPVPSPNPEHPSPSPKPLKDKQKNKKKDDKHGAPFLRPRFSRSTSNDYIGLKRNDKSHNALSHLAKSSLNVMAGPMEQEIERNNKRAKDKKKYMEEQRRIAMSIANILQRQRFLLRFARALMLYGAPSHRLEDFLYSTARQFEIDGQFLYLPGCLVVTFTDPTTHTSETMILRVAQGVNLYKLQQVYMVYKDVIHGQAMVEAAAERVDTLLSDKNMYPLWIILIFYGLGGGFIGMFSFGGGWKELPITTVLSAGVGLLQNWVAPKSQLYSNVFEISSCIFVSFIGRAISSIKRDGKHVFCFGAIVQGSISLILPGYTILCGSLELQAKNLVSGSVRMFYAIIYSMFLTFGITLGSAVYGWMDHNASSDITCTGLPDRKWLILFVPMSALCLAVVNQGGIRQLPVMVIVASAAYAVLVLIEYNISNASVFTSTVGALTLGVFGNLWSRMGHGLAFTTMLPGVFVLVPGSIAAQGSLIEGVLLANSIVDKNTTTSSGYDSSTIGNLGGSMTQVAVSISVGLFLSTLLIYPTGMKSKTTGLFTF